MTTSSNTFLRYLAILPVIVLLGITAGCTLGPDFQRPSPPDLSRYTPDPLPEKTPSAPVPGGMEQRFSSREELPADWWQLFRSRQLDQLIRQALQHNQTLAATQASLRQARENLIGRSGREDWPQLDANLNAGRQRVSAATTGQPGGSTYNLFNASVSVVYQFDLFGSGRRDIEALQAQVDYQRYQLEASYLSLSANIVTAVVQEASLREQIRTLEEIISLQERQLGLVQRQVELGGAARSDLLVQQTQLAQTRAELPPLEKSLDGLRNQLAVYLGAFPSETQLPSFDLQDLQLPENLPLSLPSQLVRQRPDILAAEQLLHQASARVGVATANLYPQLTLSAALGSQSRQFGDLLDSNSTVWTLGAGLLQPVFHGGELEAARRSAQAGYSLAIAQYRETLLQAFRNVADVLQALQADARILRAQADAAGAAGDSLQLIQQQYRYGAASSLQLLDAQRQFQQTRLALVRARAARLADTAALYQALGGGWWNRDEEASAATFSLPQDSAEFSVQDNRKAQP